MKIKITHHAANLVGVAKYGTKTANHKIKFFLLFIFLSASSFAQNVRGFYVNGFDAILGNASSETTLLTYAQANNYNYMCLYSLGSVDLTNTTKKNQLASFISRAKTQYGITQVGAAGEIYSFFSNYIIPYNQGRSTASEKIDVLNFEFEFWIASTIAEQYCSQYLVPNGYSCDSAGAFAFAKTQFSQIDNAAAANGLISEVYFGWPNKGQMQWFAQRADRLLLHAYRTSDSDIYTYTKTRLADAASVNSLVNVMIIFSSESIYMGPWLQTHSITQPYTTYSAGLAAETATWKDNIKLIGYQWFKYSTMPATTSVTATVTANGPVSFCQGGNVVLSANTGTSQTYQWTKNSAAISGATNVNYTATASGDYAVKVTKSGSTVSSTAVTVNVMASAPQPVITANGPLAFCPGGNVTLSSSSATGNLWSNNATTQSITVSSTGNYTVTVTSGNCSATSAVTGVITTASPAAPTISASGPLSFCPGGSVTLTSSSATGNLWSNNATTQSITVTSDGNYTVTVTSGSCSSTSAPVAVSASAGPTPPSITVAGSTKICPGTGVLLSSSPASMGGYTWSNGATTRSIVAQAAGTYWVRTGSPTCYAQSPSKTITMKSAPSTPVITANGPTELGEGASVKLTSSSSHAYLWLNGSTTKSITVSAAGDYRVTVTGYNGCSATSASKVVTTSTCTPPPVPTISSSSSDNILEKAATLTLTASAASGWLWSTGETTQSITVSAAGAYSVRAYNSGTCYSTSLPVTVYMTVDLSRQMEGPLEEAGAMTLSLYPNPAQGAFKVSFIADNDGECMANIFDLSGRVVMTKNIVTDEGINVVDFDASAFRPGMYILTLTGENVNGQQRFMISE